MEAVRRKQSKKSKNKPKPLDGTASAVGGAWGSGDDSTIANQAVAVGAGDGDRQNGGNGHSREGAAWMLNDDENEAMAWRDIDAQDEEAVGGAIGIHGTTEANGHSSRRRSVDDEIAQNEDDIMALLGDGEPATTVVEPQTSQAYVPSAASASAASADQHSTTHRIPTAPSTLLDDIGTLTATAVPSAPNFDDSDDEEALPGSMPVAATANSARLPNPSYLVVPPPTPTTIPFGSAALHLRPSAPADPSDSPHLPPTGEAVRSTPVPSAPLEEDEIDFPERSQAPRIVTMPSAPAAVDEAKPLTVVEESAVELKGEASATHAPSAVQRLRIPLPNDDVEKAGEVVRNSIGKLRVADSVNRLYPAVLTDPSSVNGHNGVARHSNPVKYSATAAEKHPVYIKLEPHSNFEMNLLRAAASQKRQEAKMHNIEINKGDLYGRLERYLYAEYLLHSASSSLEARKNDVEALIHKVWLLETKRLSSSKRCGDQVDLEEILEFQTARFDAIQHAKLKAHLESIRQLRTVEASLHTFDRALSYFHVEQYLNEVLQEPAFVSYLNKMSAASVAIKSKTNNLGEFETVPESISFYEPLPANSTLASSVDHLKYCIDVMIFFEKKVTVDDQGLFGRVPPSFARGELVWESSSTNRSINGGSIRSVKCYACSTLNEPMEPNQWCKFCKSCGVVLFLPPSSVSNKSSDWYTSVLRFRQSLQKWISLSLRTLLRLRSLVNMPYLLMHVMYLPRISTEERSWVLRFLQFPKAVVTTTGDLREAWSEDLVDHYIAMLHLVFHPEKLRKLTTLVSSELPSRHKGTKASNPSHEWVLLENPEVLDRCYLSDEDFVAVINQFPHTFAFGQLFSCSMDTKKSFSRALSVVIEFTQSLRVFQEFEKFPARVAQLLGELLLNASMISAASSSGTRTGEQFFYPTLFDQLFLTALHGLLVADCNRVAWRSIRNFPFAPLSPLAKWDVLGLLLFGISSVPSAAKSANGWTQFIDKACVGKSDRPKPARLVLSEQIVSDADNAMHLMHAVARLAASASCGEEDPLGRDLVLVTTQELFLAGFADGDCRKSLGESGERAAGPISTICLAHPWVISELISLLFKYHECAETWIHVFETFPVNRWLPTPADLTHLQDWLLLDDAAAPRSSLARFLLDRINWEFDVKTGQLFTNAFLHRQVALVVAEALLVFRARRLHGRRDIRSPSGENVVSPPKLKTITKSIRRVFRFERSVDFEQWCWKLMLKLKFYSPRTNLPFVPLVNLSMDRSREGLLLRRWFPGGAGSSLVGPASIRFYDAYDQQFNPYGDGDRETPTTCQIDVSHQAALVGEGSSGVPIQDDSMVATEATRHGESSSSDLNDSAELVTSVTVTSTCDVDPIVAYLICQTTTFVFTERMDRWEPLLALLKNGHFAAAVKVLENVLPLMAKFDRVAQTTASNASLATSTGEEINHALTICMATMEGMSTDQLLRLVEALERHSFISVDEAQLLTDILHKGYIGGWEATAKTKVLSKLRFVRECSTFVHPLILPSLINEAFPQSSSSGAMLSTTAMLQGAMSWLTATLRGGQAELPSPSSANSIASTMTIRKSHLVATVPSAVSTPTVTATAAAASLGIVDAPDDYTPTTQQICASIERAFDMSTTSALKDHTAFWIRMVLQVPFWFEHPALRHILDVLLRCSMRDFYRSLKAKKSGSVSGPRVAIHVQLVSILRSAFAKYCREVKRRAETSDIAAQEELPSVVSFLPTLSSMAGLSSIFGGSCEPAQFIGGCSTFAFWTLLVELRQELPLFRAMGQLLIKYEPAAMKKIEKFKKSEGKIAVELADAGLTSAVHRTASLLYGHVCFDSLSYFKIYRWAEYCLEMREADEQQILFWQVFFALYFACAGGTRVFGHYFLDREDESNPKHAELRKALHAKLRSMTTFCSNQAQIVLTVSGGSATGTLTTEGKELKYQHFVQLSHTYTAMDAWLDERDPTKWLKDDELATLPRHFEVSRLREVLQLSDNLLNSPANEAFRWESLPLWMELCGFEFHAGSLSGASSANEREDGEMTSNGETLPAMDHLQEEDFAFIEDRDTRRFSSLGSSADHGRTTSPLQLTAEYAGPVSLTVIPQVTIHTMPECCVVTPSIPLNKHAIKMLATKFSETLSILVGLDAEVLDHVSKLFVSKARTVSESKACLEGTNCRKPAAFRFEFTEWAVDKQLMDTIQSTVVQAQRYDMRSMVEQGEVSSSLATLLLNSERQRSEIGLLPDGVDAFLRLDADGLMLSMQVLLIDQVVQVLEAEFHRVKRVLIEAQATTEEETPANVVIIDDQETKAGEDKQDVSANDSVLAGNNAVKDAEKQIERLHEKGLEWFKQLTELDTKLSRMVPPLREVLWRSIKQLGITFVCVDERETCNLLQLMLEDPSRITLLSECFSPASAPARFVEMFSSLMSASTSSRLSNDEKLVLLQRFDVQAWLNTKPPHTPTKFDRNTVLSIVLGDVGSKSGGGVSLEKRTADFSAPIRNLASRGAPGISSEDEVLRFYAKIIHQICAAHLGDHLEQVLHALVGVHDDYRFHNSSPSDADNDDAENGGPRMARPAPSLVWESIVSIPAGVWRQIPFVQVEACVTFLSQHMTTLRWQASMQDRSASKGGGYPVATWQKSGALKSVLDLFTQMSRIIPEQHKWTMISTFFEPLLTTMYQPASTTDSSTASSPWPEEDSLTTGTTLCSCFVAICSDYLKTKSITPMSNAANDTRSTPVALSTKEKLDLVWSFYLNTLIPHTPVHVCKNFHQFVTRLGWEQWCLTVEIVHQMREVVQAERQQLSVSASCADLREASSLNTSPYPFVSWMVRDVLCRMAWKSTEEWLASQAESVRSVFISELGKLCVDLVLDMPHFQPHQPRSKNVRGSPAGSSANVLPPYFVNFIKQQSALWTKWKIIDADLESLLSYVFDAVMEPLRDQNGAEDAAAMLFPAMPSVSVMQDAFTRLQLVLRLASHVTSLNHVTMSKKEGLGRANLFFQMAFTIFENGMTRLASNSVGGYSATDPSAWVTVLFGACCTVLYEKLDEIVQLSRVSTDASVTEDDLQGTVVEILRLLNLRLVESFFKGKRDTESASALAWGKCGNVIFVEVDSLIREFSSSRKVSSSKALHDPADASGNGALTKSPSMAVAESIGAPLGRLLWSFMGFRGGELCCLTACGRALASVHAMSVVAERSIEKWVIEERRGAWDDLVSRLTIPELSQDEFEAACLAQGNLMTLQVLFLQRLQKAPAMTEAFALGMLAKLMAWMEKLPSVQPTTPLMEIKMLFLAAEVTNFVVVTLADVLPSAHKKQMLRELCNIMLCVGNARRQHGLMKAIAGMGLGGGSLTYSVECHVASLAIGVYLRLQTRTGAPLRVDDRIPYKLTRTTEKHLKSLEQLLASKHCFQLQKRMEWIVAFLKSPSRSLADQDEFFVSLFSRMYPTHPWMLAKCIRGA